MLYPKSKESQFNNNLFSAPTAEYRGVPFWAWNCNLEKEELLSQTKIFKDMGFGGFIMHVRGGLDVEYLSAEYMEDLRLCVMEAKRQGTYAWLYDEDRWPSGCAGGLVTKNKRFRARYLSFQKRQIVQEGEIDADGKLLSGSKLLGRYSVRTLFGRIISYTKLGEGEKGANVWYSYLNVAKTEARYNNNTYVDTLNPKAVQRFTELTHDAIYNVLENEIEGTVPAIFTDEPFLVGYGNKHEFIFNPVFNRPWTDDFDKLFASACGYSLLDCLPELFFNGKNSAKVRYDYYNTTAQCFSTAFFGTVANKCASLGLSFTGHLDKEETLQGQTASCGSSMRHYASFTLPGIDMLRGEHQFTTAKQAQAAVRQYGREGMLSELYGVSRWDTDFASYKVQGDWQAALGVTVRVPHLSLMSMQGEAKRDYPASIFHQATGYQHFSLVEDHFARLNVALTRGKPIVDIAVLHPIESFWLDRSTCLSNRVSSGKAERRFQSLTQRLLFNGFDFDFLDEALLPTLCDKGEFPLTVGKMQYKTIIIPDCKTLRDTTVKLLCGFAEGGGKLIILGKTPTLCNGLAPFTLPIEIGQKAFFMPFNGFSLLQELEKERLCGIYLCDTPYREAVCSLREDGDGLWLFVAQIKEAFTNKRETNYKRATVKVRGEWQVTLYDTLSGSIAPLQAEIKDGFTYTQHTLYAQDSLLLRYEKPNSNCCCGAQSASENNPADDISLNSSAVASAQNGVSVVDENIQKNKLSGTKSSIIGTVDCGEEVENSVPYTLSEPNALLLDSAYYALDDQPYSAKEKDVLLLDNALRSKLGFPQRDKRGCQPWALDKTPPVHKLRLKFTINSTIDYSSPQLALENAQSTQITWNEQAVEHQASGWYVDKAYARVALPPLKKGVNILELVLPFGIKTNTEWCYLLGNFGVKVRGKRLTVIPLPQKLTFSDIARQGLPFYGGALTYHTSFRGNGKPIVLSVPQFESPLITATCHGETAHLAFAPYTVQLPSLEGRTPLELTAYISRQNAFGIPHLRGIKNKKTLISPDKYRVQGHSRTNRYLICPCGILRTPRVTLS